MQETKERKMGYLKLYKLRKVLWKYIFNIVNIVT